MAAVRAVAFGQAAKLSVPLLADAPPSATLDVPGRYWAYTQRTPAGALARAVTAFAGSPAGLARLCLAEGSETWLRSLATLRPDLSLDQRGALLTTWHDDPWSEGVYSIRALSRPRDDDALARPVGPILFAGEHTAGPLASQMEGALVSGERAAAEVMGST
jgi:monoamine oxidase